MISLSRPKFWQNINLLSLALYPFSLCYRFIFFLKKKLAPLPVKLSIPVICIGNVTVGGTGKTPLAIAIGESLQAKGIKVAYLSRGFGGKQKIQGLVNLEQHNHSQVGDEALMLASTAPTYVGADRSITGTMAQEAGAQIVIMDDGMQHNSLHKDFTILALDADYRFGNGMLLPAGPLRQTISSGLAQANIIVCTNSGNETLPSVMNQAFPAHETDKPSFMINYLAKNKKQLHGKEFIGLCSIADPKKFARTVKKAGINLVNAYFYPDHYDYTPLDIDCILELAEKNGHQILTTTKDAVKMSPQQLSRVAILQLELQDKNGLMAYISNWVLSKL